ncbi:unnamed protein product [Caenorhabditis sp. 36 PRJEB53466]|nr:unnamed protein product [Caenorhabditis sp. 36 PRJEB53466]
MGRNKKNDKKRKNEQRKSSETSKRNGPNTRSSKEMGVPAIVEQIEERCVTPTAVSSVSSEDQANIEKVFSTLHVTPEKIDQPAVVDEQTEETGNEEKEIVDREVGKEALEDRKVEAGTEKEKISNGNEDEAVKETEEENVDGAVVTEQIVRSRKVSEQSEDESVPSVQESIEDLAPKYSSYWEKKDEEVSYTRTIFHVVYGRKFAAFLSLIDPEVRFTVEAGPCKTFDAEGVKKLTDKMIEEGFENAWPFEKSLTASTEELRSLFMEITEKIKFCLWLACAERGYVFRFTRRGDQPIWSAWGKGIDPLDELKTLKAIVAEMKTAIEKIGMATEESRFWDESSAIFEKVLPALEKFDSKILSDHGITDHLSSISGRIEYGFGVSEQEIDEMLETSLVEEGFGDFTQTVLRCTSVFKTIKQLKMILKQLPRMTTFTDIRVKHSGIQAITHILSVLSLDEVENLIEELKDDPKLSVEKLFGFEPHKFEVISQNEARRTHYLKIFYTAVGEHKPRADFVFGYEKLIAALICFYLILPAYEINVILFKILSTRSRENEYHLDSDRRFIIDCMHSLPLVLRSRLEIGKEFEKGEITDDDNESMYFLVKNYLRSRDINESEFPERLNRFISFTGHDMRTIVNTERVFRMCLTMVERGENQKNAGLALKLLRRPHFHKCGISREFIQDLLVLALTKYSLPDTKVQQAKYDFIDNAFGIVKSFVADQSLKIDEAVVAERWTNLGHHWFSTIYLLSMLSPIAFDSLKITLPWVSANVWDEDEKEKPADPKKYAMLAKVSLAWPASTDIEVVSKAVGKYVPSEISRVELYKRMEEYVAQFEIDKYWKSKLIDLYKTKVKFLSPLIDKKSKQDGKEKKEDTLAKEKEEEEEETVKLDEKEKEVVDHTEETAKVEESETLHDGESELENTADEADVASEANVEQAEQEPKAAEESLKTSDTQKIEINEISRQFEKSEEQEHMERFCGFYPDEIWQTLPEPVKMEIKRQRQMRNISIQK